MPVVLAAVAVVACFSLLFYAAGLGSRPARLVGQAGVVLLLPASALGAFVGLVLVGMKCDESCYGDGWTHDPDAWQWYFQFLLAVAGFGANAVAAALSLQSRWKTAAAWVVVGVAFFLGWAFMLAPLGNAFGI